MKQVFALVSLAILCGAAHCAGAEVDPQQRAECAQPDIPTRSTSTGSVRRVEKALKAWRACFRAAVGASRNVDEMVAASREYQLVKTRHAAWVAATVRHSNGQAYGRLASARIERGFWENLMTSRGNARTMPRRPDEALTQQTSSGAN